MRLILWKAIKKSPYPDERIFNLKRWVQRVLLFFALRGDPGATRLLARSNFKRKHQRLPIDPFSAQATFEDYIFQRMTGPWTPFEKTCVDKESAKLIAVSLSPRIQIARTLSVLTLYPDTPLEQVGKFIYPFVGKNAVAKPTHTSGGVIFLGGANVQVVVQQTLEMFRFARRDYFRNEYEGQYRGLRPKILVEECLPSPIPSGKDGLWYHPPPDFRFYSSRGKVLFCQYDEGRFADHRQALFNVPDHRHIPIPNQFPLPDPLPEKPAHWGEMLQIASELSGPFDFVRVDLYDLPDGVYFSEFTFTPNATFFPFRDGRFSRKLLEEVLEASKKKGIGVP